MAMALTADSLAAPPFATGQFAMSAAPQINRCQTGRTMLKLIAQDFIRLDAIEIVMPLYRELVELTRADPLNISYELFIDREDAGHFIFIEEWPDRAAVDAHCASEHFRRLVPQIDAHQRDLDTYIQMRPAFPELSR